MEPPEKYVVPPPSYQEAVSDLNPSEKEEEIKKQKRTFVTEVSPYTRSKPAEGIQERITAIAMQPLSEVRSTPVGRTQPVPVVAYTTVDGRESTVVDDTCTLWPCFDCVTCDCHTRCDCNGRCCDCSKPCNCDSNCCDCGKRCDFYDDFCDCDCNCGGCDSDCNCNCGGCDCNCGGCNLGGCLFDCL